MSNMISSLTRIVLAIATGATLWISGFIGFFGYAMMRDDMADLCIGTEVQSRPDISWAGYSLLMALLAGYLLAILLKKPLGLILSIITAVWGVAMVVAPLI